MTRLSEIQKWFGKLIAQPLQPASQIPSTTPFGTAIEEEAGKHIAPSPTLKPFKRLELYHQQYWWRLLKCLQENFPTLTRLYGYERFNLEIGIPYLCDNPPSHWALWRLGQSLPEWFKEKDLERDLTLIDAAAQSAFFSEERDPADLGQEAAVKKKLFLQPHIHLFELGADLFTFRETLLEQETSYWSNSPLPKIRQGVSYFVLYRNSKNRVKWKESSIGEYRLLTLFQKGSSIQEACAMIEGEGGEAFKEAEESLPLWFREWTYLNWFQEG
ncbi:MAG: putative DNA-binding domain-containing protein [Chlamydiales bacterium]|nr:putative DNA-binding domain-containing protein [Chlamydiales bacterium]